MRGVSGRLGRTACVVGDLHPPRLHRRFQRRLAHLGLSLPRLPIRDRRCRPQRACGASAGATGSRSVGATLPLTTCARITRAAPSVAMVETSNRLGVVEPVCWASRPAPRKPSGPGAEIAIITDVMTRARSAGGVLVVSAEKKRGKYRPEHSPFAAIAPACAHTGTGSRSRQVDAAIPAIAQP